MTKVSDENLARSAASGEHGCYEELIARYRTSVYSICYQMSGNKEDAEDWAQECFLRAYKQLAHYTPTRPFAPWFYRVVSNTCINMIRHKKSRLIDQQVSLDAVGEHQSSGKSLQQLAELSEEAEKIQQAIDTLSPRLKAALVLWMQEELTFRELGETLGVPLVTASSRVRRALLQLRSILKPEREEPTV